MTKFNEAQDWQKIKDKNLRWLGAFTYENVARNPPKEILQNLIKRYPNEAGVVYRGINFTTRENYLRFKSEFEDDQATVEFDRVTSWSTSRSTARQFAVTQPTYQLNLAVMQAHWHQQKQREAVSGYRGVILSMTLAAGTAIDVDKTDVGHESEIVVPPGVYTVTIAHEIKLYQERLADKEVTPDEVIQHMDREGLKNPLSSASFFDYVLHHHGQHLNSDSQQHLIRLFGPQAVEPLFLSDVKVGRNYFTKKPETHFDYHIPSWRLFELAQQGVFDNSLLKKIQQLGKRIIRQALPLIAAHLADAENFNPSQLRLVSKVSGDTTLDAAIKQALRPAVQALQQEVRSINQIEDPRERQAAIKSHGEKMVKLLDKIAR